jgi:hypothetical protein
MRKNFHIVIVMPLVAEKGVFMQETSGHNLASGSDTESCPKLMAVACSGFDG